MKAFRITSTEYQANTPHIFLMAADGVYYGDLDYPRLRNYPQDVEYWKTATCADSDRYFHVEEVEVSEGDIVNMRGMHTSMNLLGTSLKEYSRWRPLTTKEEREADEKYNREVWEHNKPIEREIGRLEEEIRKIIVGLKNVGNE